MIPQLVLASSSPRRAALLRQIGISFQTCPVRIDESVLENEDPELYGRRLAQSKAAEANPDSIPALGADTTVVLDGQILGKPRDKGEARSMLQNLSGNTHQVITAVSICDASNAEVLTATSTVTFRKFSNNEISNYMRTGEPFDKAGSYAVQGIGAIFVERIVGQPSTVIGLPLLETEKLLRMFNIETWRDRLRG